MENSKQYETKDNVKKTEINVNEPKFNQNVKSETSTDKKDDALHQNFETILNQIGDMFGGKNNIKKDTCKKSRAYSSDSDYSHISDLSEDSDDSDDSKIEEDRNQCANCVKKNQNYRDNAISELVEGHLLFINSLLTLSKLR